MKKHEISRDILSKYLGEREMEVVSMMSLLYDEDVIRRNYMKEVIGEAKDKGRTQQTIETAIKLRGKGMTVEDIAEVVGFSVDVVRKWIAEVE